MEQPEHIQYPRYTDQQFPGYRFIPGEQPHPTRHPAGHSYHRPGTVPQPVIYKRARQWKECPDYLYGCDLYNHAYWWEAHETWEGLWRLARKDTAQRHYLQGLIQVAVCHMKFQMGIWAGVRNLRRTSSRHFRDAFRMITAHRYMGLDLKKWHDSTQTYYEHLFKRPNPESAGHDPERYPYIVLE